MGTSAPLDIKHIFYFGIAALAIFALAGPMPDIATMLVLVLIAGVVITHASDYIALTQSAAPTPNPTTGGTH